MKAFDEDILMVLFVSLLKRFNLLSAKANGVNIQMKPRSRWYGIVCIITVEKSFYYAEFSGKFE